MSAEMKVLVLDGSAYAGLEAASLVERALRLRLKLAVADVLYERELAARGGEALRRLGLRVATLADVGMAVRLHRNHPVLSAGDAFACALASANAWMLVTRNPALEAVAVTHAVPCRGVDWLVAEIARREAARFDLYTMQRPPRVDDTGLRGYALER
ncbi:MAG TPA: hypothetical protein VJ011_09300 [Steroidobacteraceae bacterium]|nr:hypothetical protein [Steroidobacteraceae bacterium]